ncbi:MAG: sensor histidine kinase [Acidothermaceae bacterium]
MKKLRRWALELFLVALAAAEATAMALSDIPSKPAAVAVSACSALVLIGRRWQPLLASVLAFALLATALTLTPDSPNVQFFGLMATFAIAAGINDNRGAVVAWAVGAALLGVGTAVAAPPNWVADFLLTLTFCTVMWGAGWLVSRRTRRAELMTLRALRADWERAQALREERARIARELHDVVSHGLSVVVLQTLAARGALADLTELDAAAASEVDRHLDAVESTARDALGEMRRMLGLLQVDDFEESELATPTPGLHHLPLLVERARSAGLDVDDSAMRTDLSFAPGLEMSVYRVVQEALTNAVKHAPGAHVAVRVGAEGDRLVVEVADDGARGPLPAAVGSGGGHGLVGMRERLALYGGTLQTAPGPAGGFTVRASFPADDARAANQLAANQLGVQQRAGQREHA